MLCFSQVCGVGMSYRFCLLIPRHVSSDIKCIENTAAFNEEYMFR